MSHQQQQITTTSSEQRSISRTEQQVTRQIMQTTQRQVHEGFIVQQSAPRFGNDAAPPVFEQIFKNARFAQGGDAVFQGKVTGIPKPFVSWTRKGAPLLESSKYHMMYDQQTGNVVLTINHIGPGDEGEYTCSARNQYGEAICSVFIQPEGHTVQQIPQNKYGSQRVQQTQNTLYSNNYHTLEEDFKVDTFEYRLLREVSFRQSVTKRYLGEQDVKFTSSAHQGPVVAPQVLQKPRNSKLMEGSNATFTVKVSTAKDTRLTWFRNGQRLVNGPKHQINFTNQLATLNIPEVQCEDSGHYTLLVENPQGCVVSSAYLAVESVPIVYDRSEDKENIVTKTQHNKLESVEAVEGKMLAPNFVRVCGDRDVTEGKMTRFEVRVTGKPYPEVSWYINGQNIKDDATHKILVNESGDHCLMITNVSKADAGQVVCVARSRSGETSFQCKLGVVEKELVVAPKFVQRFTPANVNEEEPVTLSVRAVGTPVPRITWQKDGVMVSEIPGKLALWTEGGGSVLEIASASPADAGWYQCTAQNTAGSTATRARLNVIRKPEPSDYEDKRLRFPKPTRVIEPEPEPEPEVVFLKHVERAKHQTSRPEEDKIYPPPRFIVPLSNISQHEDGRIHFEARIEPVGDPSMNVEWFVNGYPLKASSRVTTLFNYGFIALDILSIIQDDAGEYTCRVTSNSGTAQSLAVLGVQGRDEIDKSSQYPDSLKYIEQLEDYSKYQRTDSYEEVQPVPPTFVRPLHDMGDLNEGRYAHFEAQLNPVSDPTMKVEWYKDGKPITASSRITTIFNFGYVSLNIMHLRTEDSGEYTLRAINRWGEIMSTARLNVIAHSNITGDLGYPEQQRYIEQTEALEKSYQQHKNQEYKTMVPESVAPPQFKTPIKDQINVKEGGFAHFEARLEPLGDSTLQVEWLKDGKPVEASSRMTVFFNFGYVALTIKQVTSFDIGTYTCRAYNNLGDASTSAALTVLTRKDIVQDSQYPGGIEKFQYLEDSKKNKRKAEEETIVTQKPRFLGPLKGTNKIAESQRAHFEVRVEPQNDVTMKIEWYFNGRSIMSANRIQTYHDFGYVALDILSVRAEDTGTYEVVARNAIGEAQLSTTMQVEVRANIDTTTMHRGVVEKAPYLEARKFTEPQYDIEEISKSKPIFIQPLSDPQPVNEGKNVHLECRLEPMGDPTMRVEWFQNGKPVTVGSRFRTYYDFGYVALDIIHVTSIDSGEYTVRATNHLGSAHTSACVNIISRSGILTESQNEYALEQIQLLEDASRYQKMVIDDETVMQAPQFTKSLHNIQTSEGTNVHLECRLKPIGDSTMRVDWLVNGRSVKIGHRFRPAYDFDYVALDILSVYPEDSGVYTCQARNEMGEAVTSSSVKVIAKKDLILDTQNPSGLEKIQYLEDTSRYKKAEMFDEEVKIMPRFLTKPKNVENLKEGQHAHFECKLEPVTDSNLKVEWFKNGRPIIIGHRFRPIHDFGYVALDIIDLIEEDSGTYTCRAINLIGADETNCHLSCRGSKAIVTEPQNEMGLEQIQYLEERTRYHRKEEVEETTTQAPIFTTSLKNCDIKEGQRAHFECRLIPVSDSTMKVEWFHNNVPIKFGSRFTETNNFGFVAFDILQCLPEDSGTYTCRATNWLGQSITSGNLNVQSRKSIYLESQHQEALGRLSQLENANRYQRHSVIEDVVTQAPVFTQPMRDLKTVESQSAHFEARLIPVGDDKLKVEWLRNGIPIQASNRVTTMHDFGYVALNLKYVYPEDSGTYTCRAVNELGQAVTSATLDVQSKASLQLESQHEAALSKLRQLEDQSKYQRSEEKEIEVTEAPKFIVPLNGTEHISEGQSAHYECRIEPYPDNTLKLEWLHNGKPLQTGHRFRTTYDFGFASLDVLSALPEDSGEYTCRAINKIGRAESSVKLGVQSRASIIRESQHQGALQKIQYLEDDSRYKRAAAEEVLATEKPQFGRPLKNVEHLPEGKSVHLEATLIPVNDPTMKVEWFRNGIPIPQGHRFKTTYDFGFVALDVLYAYPEDSGTYMCKAKNAAGEAVTTCIVTVDSKAGLQLDTLDEDRLKKIKQLEAYERPAAKEAEFELQKPVFLTPLNSLELKEGEHAHLETRIEPINDTDLTIEWFVNGVSIKTGHRFKTTHDFGYVALDILYAYGEDSGTYMCKATNKQGEAVNTCQINVASRRSIYLETQHPDGLEKIRELEAQGRPAKLEIDEPPPMAPVLTELWGTTEVAEGKTAHFECQVKPIHDSNLKVEFFHNDKPLGSASRFHTTHDFGYISLDIGHVVPEDAGKYTVKATNALGQAVSNITLKVQDSGSIILDSQRPEGLDKIRELELAVPFKRPDYSEPITKQRPMFTHPLQNIDSINEGQTAHFECRLIPVGDATMTVEWFRNGQPLETSSRITKSYDFGYISLDISHVRDEDNGVYSCKATNVLGEAVTTASMHVRTKDDIQLESQHPEGLKKIVELERSEPMKREELERVFEKPIFTQLLTGPSELIEGQHAHFECRVVPVGDPTLHFEWYVNGVELKMGSRFHTTHDFGFVTLDISQTVAEDSGVYTCKAINRAGEAVSSTSLKIRDRSSIVREPLQPDSWEQIQLKEAEMNRVPEMFIDTRPQQAPVFTTHLQNQDSLVEGQHVHLEAQVEPRADPNLRIEWFKNGESLTTGSRIRSTFDFGLITLAINSLRPDDSAIYTCKATNLLGEAVSTCTLKIVDTNWLLSNTLHPDSLSRIEALEKPQPGRPEGPEPVYESPVFISHLNNWECKEGSDAHFECQVEPSKDPTMKIEWFLNGKPLQTGSRFKPSYDFGFITLDIKQALAEDSGIYTCKATNDKGYAVTTGTLKCTGFQGIHLDTQHPQGITGLEKVQQVEDTLAHKYQRQPSLPEAAYPKPIFIVPLEAEFILPESAPLHLEARVEPKDDPSLKIEWYFNGQVLDLGSRFKTNNDFGFVTLDLTDVYDRDQGVYTCKAYNHSGETYTSTTVYCSSKDGLIEHTQHPKGEEGLEKIQNLEESLQKPKQGVIDKETGHAPAFTSQFKDLGFLSEGEIAHYEASLIPVGDQKMKVEWFYNGKVIEASHRIRTIYAFGMVVLEILGTKIIDTGTYTCRATNDYGTAETSVTLECVERITGQKPKFTSQIESLEGLKDGDSAHFECTLIPVNDPDLKVEWFHNGKPLLHKNRVKMISDFGYVVMDIAYVQNHDAGEYVCKASNKYGEDTTRAKIQCFGKGGVYVDSLQPSSLARIQELENPVGAQRSPSIPVLEAPKFVSQITDITNLKEGQSAHFEARVTPVNDPNLVVEWYFNGEKLQHGHRFRTFHDFGIVILDILCCYEENSGVYECRAFNKVGSDSTKAKLRCLSKTNLILESQLPQGMEGGLEKIQTLEDSTMKTKGERASAETRQAPIFTEPLSNIDSLREGESAHFEGRLTPIDDPNLKVEWYWNGKPLKAGSRFRTFCEFGFVILEISPVYPEDSGDYSCRATNNYGEAVSISSMKVQGKRSIIMESQLPKGMEGTIDKIAELEGLGQSKAIIETEDEMGKAPEFITTPADLSLPENSLSHFECRLLPANDPSMVVTWFHNGKVLSAGSRIKTINDFGFVILEVAGVYIRDSGLYTCKATNKHGEATVTCKLQVKGRQGIVLEPQLPNNFRTGTESIQKLEENMYKKEETLTEDEKPNPPKFIVELKDALDVQEAKSVRFECRVEPINDPTLRIDWFFNGKPFATGSRVHVVNDFGFISLDMDYVYSRDSGEYICRATNKWGTAITKANLTCTAKLNVILDSQLPDGMSGEKLKALEQGPVQEKIVPDEIEAIPPKFLSQIESATVEEASSVHFETRVEPKNDSKLRVEWYRNGKPLPSGHRYKTLFDLGFVSLDILSMYAEDSGEYVCRAVNDHGEAITKAMVTCKQLPTILLQNQVPKGMKKSEALTQMEAAIKKYTSEIHLTEDDLYEPEKKQPPRFVTQINDQLSLVEMESTKFECQLAPVGDPNMKVEWFLNGKPLRHKNRFNPIYDFGYVAMNFGWVYPEDSGEYVCRATNLYGQDETRAMIKTAGKPGIIYESQLPKGMKSIEKIREMEASWQVLPEEKEEEEKRREPPQFVSKPEPVTICEGDWARFCCRVTGFPRPRVMWLVNGNTVVNGMRYKLNYDGMWHLDIPKTRQYDHGKVEVIARNSVGESRVETMLTVKSRHDDYRGVLKNSPRPWYDSDLVQYQKDLQENELEKVFTERASTVQQSDYGSTVISAVGEHIKQKQLSEPKPEWTETVKQKKNEEYYNKLSRLEGNQVIKETKIREASHQMPIPGEKIVSKNKGTANEFEETLVKEKKEELMPWQTKILKARADHDSQFVPDPSESSVHGKEVHVSTQKQTQKEIQGNKEINRKITSTETTEMEHSGNTQEKMVQGKVEPSKPPIFTKKIQPCRAFEQDQARFEVEFDGEPLPTIKWYREDFLIQNSPDFQIHTFSTKSILVIRQVFMEDSGVFAVIAENRGGKAKCSANLVVEERKQVGRKGPGPPSFLTTIQGSVVKAGQLARFDVKISANKPLDVYWLKNGKKISQDIRYKTIDEDNQYTLLILETATEDSGTYECVAINNSGEARCEAQLLVQPLEQKTKPKGKPTGKEQAPAITQPLSGQVIHEGQPVTFTCKISGQPPINVKWQKGDKVIKPSKYFRMTQDGETVALHISEVFPEDEGTYKCFVSNAGGQAVLSADLKVIVPENQDEAPTLSPMRDVVVPEGSSAQFRTQVTGKPQPTIQWFREGTLIPDTPDFKMLYEENLAVLLIKSTYEEDSGVFICRATNSGGQVETSARLTVKSKK
ncbi:titin isoform X5 [Adelges cooleyi]|uniref:titin isoform X5 n=1 Tax=Adelges cooleyi TaxID=133065 RepID=UPI00217F781A|nr:titin isoform X5 [Adelges cooleyi]